MSTELVKTGQEKDMRNICSINLKYKSNDEGFPRAVAQKIIIELDI